MVNWGQSHWEKGQRKHIPGTGNSKPKGPETGTSLSGLQKARGCGRDQGHRSGQGPPVRAWGAIPVQLSQEVIGGSVACWLGTWAQSWMAWFQIPPSHQAGDFCLIFLPLSIPIVKWSCALGIRRQVQHDLKGAIGLNKEGRRAGKKREGA